MKLRFGILATFVVATACAPAGVEGLRPTPDGDGPVVNWDPLHRPLPDIPLPNDIATWSDPSSPTGKRVNASMVGPTNLESGVRRQLDQLDGFGVYMPIWLSFNAPLDLVNIQTRHARDMNLADDAVYLVNIDPASAHFGQAQILDVGWGNFPVQMERTCWFPNDLRCDGSNVLFETVDEVALGQDTNFDGVLSRPNTLPRNGDPYTDLITFYEMATDTLIVRPLYALEEQTEYAVILTERLTGVDGDPVRSPFDYVNHAGQMPSLKRLVSHGVLDGLGLRVDDVAFAWTYTTQSTKADLVALRKGLDGQGTFGWMSETAPTELSAVDNVSDNTRIVAMLEDYGEEFIGRTGPQLQEYLNTLDHVDYFVSGTFDTPYFLDNEDGAFNIDRLTGQADVTMRPVTWWISVPRARAGSPGPPYPVVFYLHGHGSSRAEIVNFAGVFARFGIATVALDAVGHGGGVSSEEMAGYDLIMSQYGLSDFAHAVLGKGRARDLTGDGVPDSGADYWTADPFHTRDVVRQTAVDHFVMTRILRSFDGETSWDFDVNGDGQPELAGDFNSDGVVDIGGPYQDIAMAGGSLGGILTGVIAPVEPNMTTATSFVGGAGLSDIALRTTLGGVNAAILLHIIGPLVVTEPDGDDTVLGFYASNYTDAEWVPFTALKDAQPGDRIEVTNHKTEQTHFGVLDAERRTRINIESDVGDPYSVVVFKGAGPDVRERIETFGIDASFQGRDWYAGEPLASVANGHGEKRQTPGFRRFLSFAAMAMEPADPVVYAPLWHQGPDPTNLLVVPFVGDQGVPVNTEINFARAVGIVATDATAANESSLRYGGGEQMSWSSWLAASGLPADTSPNDILLDNYVIEGLEKLKRFDNAEILFDVDNLDEGLDGFGAPQGALPLRATRILPHGVSAMRIPYTDPTGTHSLPYLDPDLSFDIGAYTLAMAGHYIRSRGRELVDDVCLADLSCPFIPPALPRRPRPADVPPAQ